MNSMSLEVYAGPTDLPLSGRGTMSSRILLRFDVAARLTIVCLGFNPDSGSVGTRESGTERNLAMLSRSESSHASTSRTATRQHNFGDFSGSKLDKDREHSQHPGLDPQALSKADACRRCCNH